MHGAVVLGRARDCTFVRQSSGAINARNAECEWLNQKVGPERLLRLTLNPALTNLHTDQAPLGPHPRTGDLAARAVHVLLPKDYVRFRLSGEYAIDVADASGTLMTGRRAAPSGREELLERRRHRCAVDASYGVRISGDLRAGSSESASVTGLVAGTPLSPALAINPPRCS
jgi:xylulokinase